MVEPPSGVECSFRRVAPPELRAALAPGGPFHDLVDLAQSEPLLDLHIRALASDGGRVGHATLYLGLTQVISLHQRGDQFWLEGPRKTKTFKALCDAYFAGWTTPQTLSQLDVVADGRIAYIRDAIAVELETGLGRWTKREGALQAALSTWPRHVEILDRECVLQHPSDAIRREHIVDACGPAMAVAKALGYRKALKNEPEPGFGNELDALAVDADGRILVIEAKDGADTVGVGWTPAQVSVYLRLLRRWVHDSGEAADDLEAMLAQRRQLGFPESGAAIGRPLQLVPVIALKAPLTDARRANALMSRVRNELSDVGEELAGLELWLVDGGSRTQHEIGSLPET